jgi:AcrR family transcriptional regulator
MIESAAVLMRERGIEATSFSSVIDHSGAPRGSIYHHFPEGKAQLIEEATRFAGAYSAAMIAAALEHGDVSTAVDRFVAFWRSILTSSEFAAGCPVVAAALDVDPVSRARGEAGGAFGEWRRLLAQALESRGVDSERAAALATVVIASVEGAVVLCRAERSLEPLEHVAAELEQLLSSAIEN